MGKEAFAEKKKNESVRIPVKETKVTNELISRMPEVAYVYARKGKTPDIILIGQSHPGQSRNLNLVSGKQETMQSMKSIEKICATLYDDYNVKSIIMEGIPPAAIDIYQKYGKITAMRHEGTAPLMLEFESHIERVMNKRKWELRSGEITGLLGKEDQQKDIVELCAEFSKTVDRIAEQAIQESGKIINGKFSYDKDKFMKIFDKLYEKELAKANHKMELLLTPKRMDRLYQDAVLDREQKYIEQAKILIKEGKGPVILIIGMTHMQTMTDRIKDGDFITICPLNPSAVNAEIRLNKEILKKSFLAMLTGNIDFTFNMSVDGNGKITVTH